MLASLAPLRTSPARPPNSQLRIVATTVVRSPARPAREMGDSCRQVSWLAARARRLRLPAGCPAVALGATLAAYSCGGSRGFEAGLDLAPRSLFTAAARTSRDETVTREHRSKRGVRLSTERAPSARDFNCAMTARQRRRSPSLRHEVRGGTKLGSSLWPPLTLTLSPS